MSFVATQLYANGSLPQAIDLFEHDVGRVPTSLDELYSFSLEDPDVKRWKGPYLCDPQGTTDPWGNAYHYDPTGNHSGGRYDLWSSGPNGDDETSDGDRDDGDDIRSWK